MREYVIILPRTANYACEWLRTSLLHQFGGYTEHEATGAWKDPTGAVIFDDNAVFTVATDRVLYTMRDLRVMARRAGLIGDQQCVYLRDSDGNVEFVDCKEKPNAKD